MNDSASSHAPNATTPTATTPTSTGGLKLPAARPRKVRRPSDQSSIPKVWSSRTLEQPSGLGIDWLSICWRYHTPEDVPLLPPEFCLGLLLRELLGHGGSPWRPGGYDSGLDWGDGITLVHSSTRGKLDIKGTGCRRLGVEAVLRLMRAVSADPHCHATRIDVFADLHPAPPGLIESIHNACKCQCMHLLRGYTIHQGASDAGKPESGGIYLGSSKSNAQVLVYDKGAQLATHAVGEWVRWEARYRNHAAQALLKELTDPRNEPLQVVRTRCISLVEFRRTKRDSAVKRRKNHWRRAERCPFFAQLADGIAAGTLRPPPRLEAGIGRALAYGRKCLAPLARVAQEAGVSFAFVIETLLQEQDPDDLERAPTPRMLQLAALVKKRYEQLHPELQTHPPAAPSEEPAVRAQAPGPHAPSSLRGIPRPGRVESDPTPPAACTPARLGGTEPDAAARSGSVGPAGRCSGSDTDGAHGRTNSPPRHGGAAQ